MDKEEARDFLTSKKFVYSAFSGAFVFAFAISVYLALQYDIVEINFNIGANNATDPAPDNNTNLTKYVLAHRSEFNLTSYLEMTPLTPYLPALLQMSDEVTKAKESNDFLMVYPTIESYNVTRGNITNVTGATLVSWLNLVNATFQNFSNKTAEPIPEVTPIVQPIVKPMVNSSVNNTKPSTPAPLNITKNIINKTQPQNVSLYNNSAINEKIGLAPQENKTDDMPPITAIIKVFDANGQEMANGDNIKTKTFDVFFNASDNVGVFKFECNQNGGMWLECKSPYTVHNGITNNQNQTLEIRAIDTSYNIEQTPAVFLYR